MCDILWVQSGFVCLRVSAGSVAVQVWKSGGERCVDLERQKRGQEINPKKVGKPK